MSLLNLYNFSLDTTPVKDSSLLMMSFNLKPKHNATDAAHAAF